MKPISKIVNPVFEETSDHGTFVYQPLANGYGMTLAVALRRVLLSSIPGCGIVSVAIEGIEHKFSTIPGMVEDVLSFIENLKQIKFKLSDALNSVRISINLKEIMEIQKEKLDNQGPFGYFTLTSQMMECPEGVFVLNDHPLCTCSIDCDLRFVLSVKRGSGYVDYSTKEASQSDEFIPVRSIGNAVLNCSYEITKNFRHREWNDYESLSLSVKTDGSIKPSEAVKKACSILTSIFSSVGGLPNNSEYDDGRENIPAGVLENYILDIDSFSKSTASTLVSFGIYTLGDLAASSEKSLLEMNGIGHKKVKDIKALLSSFNLSLKREKKT